MAADLGASQIHMGTRFMDFLVGSQIGHGAFGQIYVVIEQTTGILWAMKIEQESSPRKTLEFEYQIMSQIQSSGYFPRLGVLGRGADFVFFTMELLGPSLSVILKNMPNNRFDLETAIRASYHILKAIEAFHDMGFVHRDIKPANILTREGCEHPICLLDYGLSKVYKDPKTGEHLDKRSDIGFRGTRTYASLNALMARDLSRKDDLISWYYLMIELVVGQLPWRGISERAEIAEVKSSLDMDAIMRGILPEMVGAWDEINELGFTERPDYDGLYGRMDNAMGKMGVKMSDQYQWTNLVHVHRQRVVQSIDTLAVDCDVVAHEVKTGRKAMHDGLLGPIVTAAAPFSQLEDHSCCNCILL